jgi:hypothetical protein
MEGTQSFVIPPNPETPNLREGKSPFTYGRNCHAHRLDSKSALAVVCGGPHDHAHSLFDLVECETTVVRGVCRIGIAEEKIGSGAAKCFVAWLLDGLFSPGSGSSKAFSSVRSTASSLPAALLSLDWHGPSHPLSLFSLYSLFFPRRRLSLF